MDRRRLLALLGSAGLGGCLGARSSDSTETTPRTTKETTDATTTAETTRAEPPDVGTPDPQGGPPFDSDVKRYVYAPAVDDSPLGFAPAEQSGSLPKVTFSFTLSNDTDATFDTNFYAWKIWKRVDGEWFHVAPRMWPEPLMRLGPDQSHT